MFLAIFPYISCVAQLCLTLCDRMDCTLPGSSVHGLLQARILLQAREWVAIPFFRGSSRSRDWTLVSCIAGRFFTVWATRYFMSQQHLWVIHFLFINSPSSLDFQHSTPLRFPPTLGFNFPLASSSSQTLKIRVSQILIPSLFSPHFFPTLELQTPFIYQQLQRSYL